MIGRRPISQALRVGFTMIEVCLAIVIIGVGITASMLLMGTSTTQNAFVAQTTVSVFLAENIREMLASVPYCNAQNPTAWAERSVSAAALAANQVDLDDFDGEVFGRDATDSNTSPVDAEFQPVATLTTASGAQPFTSLAQYTQKITVEKLSATDLSTLADTATDAGIRRITVDILYRSPGATTSQKIYTLTIFRFKDLK